MQRGSVLPEFAIDHTTGYCRDVAYQVHLIYFRQTGKFLARAEMTVAEDKLVEIWDVIDDMRRMGRLPGLRQGAGRDLFVLVDVTDHPERVLHLIMPPFMDEDDVTPPRISTGEMVPLVRVPLAEIPRTTTRDIVRPAPIVDVGSTDDEITPVEVPRPEPPDDSSSDR
jgi:hypothetical protein